MFETLFADPRLIEKHRSAPLLEERLGYIAYWKESGATHGTLRDIAHYLVCLCRLVDLNKHTAVSLDDVVEAVDNWSLLGGRCKRQLAHHANRKRFIGHARRWLHSLGRLEEPQIVRHAHHAEVAAYVSWMKNKNGWSAENIRARRYLANSFCDWLDECGISLVSITFADIDQFMTRYRLTGRYSRVTIQSYARRLRTFIRYAELQGLCAQGLAEGIIPSRTFHGDTIPPRLARNDVLRLLATTESETVLDVRDRAILMLLITYGVDRRRRLTPRNRRESTCYHADQRPICALNNTLVHCRRQHRLQLPLLGADHRQAALCQAIMEPLRPRTCLETDARHLDIQLAEEPHQGIGLAQDPLFPDDLPSFIHHTHARPFQRHVQSRKLLHGCSSFWSLPPMQEAQRFGARVDDRTEEQPPYRRWQPGDPIRLPHLVSWWTLR